MQTSKPSKHRLQTYLTERHASASPPPTPEQIRRELGWNMLHPKPERGR